MAGRLEDRLTGLDDLFTDESHDPVRQLLLIEASEGVDSRIERNRIPRETDFIDSQCQSGCARDENTFPFRQIVHIRRNEDHRNVALRTSLQHDPPYRPFEDIFVCRDDLLSSRNRRQCISVNSFARCFVAMKEEEDNRRRKRDERKKVVYLATLHDKEVGLCPFIELARLAEQDRLVRLRRLQLVNLLPVPASSPPAMRAKKFERVKLSIIRREHNAATGKRRDSLDPVEILDERVLSGLPTAFDNHRRTWDRRNELAVSVDIVVMLPMRDCRQQKETLIPLFDLLLLSSLVLHAPRYPERQDLSYR